MAKRAIGQGLMDDGSKWYGHQAQGDAARANLPSGPLKTFAQAVEEDGEVPSGYRSLILMDVDERDGSVVFVRILTPGWEAQAVDLERLMAGSKVRWREEAKQDWRAYV